MINESIGDECLKLKTKKSGIYKNEEKKSNAKIRKLRGKITSFKHIKCVDERKKLILTYHLSKLEIKKNLYMKTK